MKECVRCGRPISDNANIIKFIDKHQNIEHLGYVCDFCYDECQLIFSDEFWEKTELLKALQLTRSHKAENDGGHEK